MGGWVPMSYHLLVTLSPPKWLCIKLGSCVSHFNVSLIVWAKSRDSVHKAQFLKRKESPSGLNRGPSAYQPSTVLLGQTSSLLEDECTYIQAPYNHKHSSGRVHMHNKFFICLKKKNNNNQILFTKCISSFFFFIFFSLLKSRKLFFNKNKCSSYL